MVRRRHRKRRWGPMLLVVLAAVGLSGLVMSLPLRWLPPPTTAFILQAKNGGLGSAPPCPRVERKWVDWQQIAPAMSLAVLASEDQRFPLHWGLDLEAIMTALEERQTTGRVRGASTITQQLVKNLYLWPGQDWLRKSLEVWLALTLEATWPKRRILELYLNVAQFGACTFGVQAASRRFFHKDAARLTAREAARMAAVLPNPVRYRVDRPAEFTQRRTSWILQQMRSLGGTAYLRALR